MASMISLNITRSFNRELPRGWTSFDSMGNAIYVGWTKIDPGNHCWPGKSSTDRRINTFFSLSKRWETNDAFARQKLSTFKSSRPAVLELAARCKEITENAINQTPELEMLLFKQMWDLFMGKCYGSLTLDISHVWRNSETAGIKSQEDPRKNFGQQYLWRI